MTKASKYDIAMAIVDSDSADDGTGLTIAYSDYKSRMTPSQFEDMCDDVSKVTKMLGVLQTYRPSMYASIKQTADPAYDPPTVEPFTPFWNKF